MTYSSTIGSMSSSDCFSILMLPRMNWFGLLISWPMPLTSCPREASLSACWSCCSYVFSSVTSR